MNCRKEGIGGTTAGILATLTAIGTGVGMTLWQASKFAAKCKASSSFVSLFASQNITLPSTATVIFQGTPVNVTLDAEPIQISSILGEAGVKAFNALPETLSEFCHSEILMQGAAFTAIIASGLLLFTYSYRKNQLATADIKKVKAKIDDTEVRTVSFT